MILQNIIGFQLSGESDKRMQAINPSTLSPLPESFVPASPNEVNQAVKLAKEAWRTFRQISGTSRASFLREIASGIEALGDTLMNRVHHETSYPVARIIVERNRTCVQLRMFADIAASDTWREITVDEALPDRPSGPRPDLRKMMIPLGPVVVFGASNFPLAYSTAGGDVASALAVGCPVIIKAHEAHPGTNALVAEVIMQAAKKTGMPDGVFSSLIGDGFETGRLLVEHPDVAAVGFTGSQTGGRALFDMGQKRSKPIPVFAEMGSVNPVFIFPGPIEKDYASLAVALAGSMTMTVGQFCTNPGIQVVLRTSSLEDYVQELKNQLEKVPEAYMLTRGIATTYHRGVAAVHEEEGINMIFKRETTEENMAAPALATVPAEVFLRRPNLHHEVFGPFSLIVVCEDMHQMQQVAESLEGQLTATIHSIDAEQPGLKQLVRILIEKAGRIISNGVPTGVEVCAAMTHGGPYPASTDSRYTAVGHHALRRWIRPVTFQNFGERSIDDVLMP